MLKLKNVCLMCALKTRLLCLQNQIMVKHNGFRSSLISVHNSISYNVCRKFSTHATIGEVATAKELASKLGTDSDSLMHLLTGNSNLLKISPLKWETCIRELTSNGFATEESLHMVTKYPPILQLPVESLALSFKQWRGVDLGEKYVLSLLKSCPKFLCVPGREISLRMAYLKPLGSSKSIVTLLKNAPNIMLDNRSEFLAKLSFLQDEMRVENKLILKSYALNRSLLFLKTRFIFLERCGKYVKPKHDADPNIPSKNPPMKSIVENSNENFATKIAGVTLEEYEVFEELYAMEADEESDLSDYDSE